MRKKHLLGPVVWIALCASAHSQSAGDRARTWEAGFHITDMSSVSIADRFGAAIDVDNDVGYGFAGGYNFTNRLAVMLDASWSAPDYIATFVPDGPGPERTISTELDVATVQVKGVLHFLEGNLTPFIEAGVGWTNVDSNIIDGPVITDCWWDFFWGFVCRNFYETYSETEVSYSVGVGFRWDFDEDFTMRGSVGRLEIDIDSAAANPRVDTLQFAFGWRF